MKIFYSVRELKKHFLFISAILFAPGLLAQTTFTWTGATSGAWLTTTNWSPTGSPTLASQLALFNSNAQPNDGMNMNTLGGGMTIAALHFSTGATTSRTITNSSTTVPGTLTLAGTAINGVPNTIIRNLSSGNHTITNGSNVLGLALSNTTNNVISLDGSGNIVITSSINTIGGNTPLFIQGSNTGATLTFNSTANTFTGDITINGNGAAPTTPPEFVMAADGSLGNTTNNINIDGGRLTGSGTFTISSTRSIKTSSVVGSSISSKTAGSIITYNGIISNYSTTIGSWAKQGAGVLKLGGANTYSGTTSINSGTLQLISNSNRLPTTTTLFLGQASSANLGVFDLNGFNQQIAGLNSIAGTNGTASKNTVTSATSSTLTLNIASGYTATYGAGTAANSGIITGAISVVKSGNGVQVLGDLNTYTGLTQINSGELLFSPPSAEALSSSAIILNGGTFGTSGITTGASITFSTLNISDNSIINLSSSNSHTINFASSSGVSWTSAKTLTITGWQGVYSTSTGTMGTTGRIFVGSNNSALTASQLSQIKFFDGTQYYGAILLNTGELSPYCIAPSISLISNNSPVCAGSPLTFSINATGTLNPIFSWSGPNSFTSAAQNPTISAPTTSASGVYTIIASNSCGSASSTISATVNQTVVPSVTVTSSANSFCSASPITINFTANVTNGGGSPTYQWKLNGVNVGSNQNTYSNNNLSNGDQVYCNLVSSAACPVPSSVNSNTKTITVTTTPTLTSMPDITVCGGQTVSAIIFTTSPSGQPVSWINTNTVTGLAAVGSGSIAAFAASNVTSTEVSNIQATPFTGVCFGTPVSFSLTVNGPQPSTIWNGTLSTDWFNPNNWSNCVCGSASDATIASGAPNYPVINGTVNANVNNLTIISGASLSAQSGQSLYVFGNWYNNGAFSASTGVVTFSGSSAQTIGGSSSTAFYDLTLDNSGGLTLNSVAQIYGSLQLNNGTFNTSNMLTLKAVSGSSGKIGPIAGSADISGNVTVEQFAPGGATGWALLGAPIISPLTMADWNDNFAITCQNCPDGYMNFTSIYSYDETAPGSYSATAKYVGITNITDAIASPSLGYWVYLGNNYPNTGDIVFDVTGTVAKSNLTTVSIPVSRTINNGPTDDGWNLISNPLPSPISWSGLRNGNANVDDAIYAYNTDLPTGFTSYVNGVSSDLVGGINDTIPMCQGFYIHATSSTTLYAPESIKINANPTFLRTNNVVKPILRLKLSKAGNFSDITTFYFEQGGSVAFQKGFDSYKLINDPTLPYIAGTSGTVITSINGLPTLTSNISVPVQAITPATGTFTFSLLNSNFPQGICVRLHDLYTNTTADILNSTYTCTLYDTTSASRFVLNVGTIPGTGTVNISQPDCSNPNGGFAIAAGGNNGPWNYVWKNNLGSVIKTSLNKNAPDSLTQLANWNYSVEINQAGTCSKFVQGFGINQIYLPTAMFAVNKDTVYVSQGGGVQFSNLSNNASFFSWNFGDGGSSAAPNPFHSYTSPGIYQASLIVQSGTYCSDTTVKTVFVMDNQVGLKDNSSGSNDIVLKTVGSSVYELGVKFSDTKNLQVDIIDVNGKLMRSQKMGIINNAELTVNLQPYPHGIYFMLVKNEGALLRSFKLLSE